MASMDGAGFTLSFSAADASAYLVNYLALGGAALTDANIVEFPGPTSTGNFSVTGMGFKPDLVLIFGAMNTSTPQSQAHCIMGFGAFTTTGQWLRCYTSVDNVTTMDTSRGQLTNACIGRIDTAGSFNVRGAYVSMDADGFTLNFSAVEASAFDWYAVGIKGGRWKVGAFNAATATGDQAVTGVGFKPRFVHLASFLTTTQAASVAHAHHAVGYATPSAGVSSAWMDSDALATSDTTSFTRNDRAFMVMRTSTAAPDGLATLARMGNDGFTLNWDTVDWVAHEILYLAGGD